MTQIKHFPSIDAFYDEQGGRTSGECDFGVWHWDDIGLFSARTEWPLEEETIELDEEILTVTRADQNSRIRVSVVDETGDVYATQSGIGEGRVALLGNVGVANPDFRTPSKDRGPVYDRTEELLNGWASTPDGRLGRGISWFINRLTSGETSGAAS